MAEAAQHRLMAILAADAAGYSRLMAADDLATLAALDAAREVFRSQVRAFQGRVVDTAGDSVLAAFPSAQGAVAAALAVQRELGGSTAATEPLRFRVGVHLGDVIEKADGTVYGDGVNIAARLQALAAPGGIVVSQAVLDVVNKRLPVPVADLGLHSVKNIDRPLHAYALSAGDATSTSVRFGRFELQPRERRLLVDGHDANLCGRALDVLIALAQRAGHLVSRNELIDLAWPGLVVEENDVSVQISALRKVLGGETIATEPGRGYRFTATIDAPAVQAPASTAAAPEAPKLPTNLPATLPPLIGRDDDLAALDALIEQHRLVTVVGPGGIGKTLLTQHLLTRRERRHAHGVCWVELAPVTDGAALPGAIAAALGVRPGSGDDPVAALARALSPLDVLIALDNAEHLLADAAAVADALHRLTPKLRLVVTSQAPLKLAAERVIRLGSLAVPQRPLPASEALVFGAVALFVERAQAADARFVLTDAAAPTVIELCRALDGMALAIELAAARAPTLGVQRLASSMHERLRVLTSSRNRAAPARQQTLRAALEWSHALLDEREQAVFRRLAVVAGSGSLELIQHIAVCERWNEWDVLDALDTLVERSLVALLSTVEGSPPRYRLLESPRAYARERLHAAGEQEAVQRTHAFALRDLLTVLRDARESGRAPFLANLDAARLESDNARDAFTWARDAGYTELAVQVGGLLLQVLPYEAVAQRVALSDAIEALLPGPLAPAQQAQVWFEIAAALADTHPRRSLTAAQRVMEILRGAPDESAGTLLPLQYRALCKVTVSAANLRDETLARQALAAALALEQTDWPLPIYRVGLQARVFVQQMFGDAAEAVRLAQRSVAIERQIGASGNNMMATLVDAHVAAGDLASAVAIGQELVARFDGSRDEMDLAYARLNLASAYLVLDDRVAARPLLASGWAQTAALDHMRPYFADYFALLAALDGQPEAAARLCGHADAAYVAFDDTRQPNEAAAVERARALARAALGDAEFERLQAEGAHCNFDEVTALALGDNADAS